MHLLTSKYWMQAYGSLSMNIASAWFGLAIVTASFTRVLDIKAAMVLSTHILFGIMFMIIHIELQKFIDQTYGS